MTPERPGRDVICQILGVSDLYRPIFPDDANAVFRWSGTTLEQVVRDDTALVALDTNTLLLPYTDTKQDIATLTEGIYSRLAKQGRLVIAGQVAREFARNRSGLIGKIHDDLTNTLDQITIPGVRKRQRVTISDAQVATQPLSQPAPLPEEEEDAVILPFRTRTGTHHLSEAEIS